MSTTTQENWPPLEEHPNCTYQDRECKIIINVYIKPNQYNQARVAISRVTELEKKNSSLIYTVKELHNRNTGLVNMCQLEINKSEELEKQNAQLVELCHKALYQLRIAPYPFSLPTEVINIEEKLTAITQANKLENKY